jgi:biotin transport system substrate-specific component
MSTAVMTCADLIRPSKRSYAFAYDTAIVLAGSALIALSARFAVYLPFSPVPVTAQTFVVLFLGALCGPGRGSLAACAYIIEGIAGIPVFAAGAFGPAYLLGPTGGYLAGFVAGAWLTGYFSSRGWDRNLVRSSAALLLGDMLLFALGAAWLSVYMGPKALVAGLVPFIPGEIIKIALASSLLPAGWKLLKRK